MLKIRIQVKLLDENFIEIFRGTINVQNIADFLQWLSVNNFDKSSYLDWQIEILN